MFLTMKKVKAEINVNIERAKVEIVKYINAKYASSMTEAMNTKVTPLKREVDNLLRAWSEFRSSITSDQQQIKGWITKFDGHLKSQGGKIIDFTDKVKRMEEELGIILESYGKDVEVLKTRINELSQLDFKRKEEVKHLQQELKKVTSSTAAGAKKTKPKGVSKTGRGPNKPRKSSIKAETRP